MQDDTIKISNKLPQKNRIPCTILHLIVVFVYENYTINISNY
jgi:hypothetical protein